MLQLICTQGTSISVYYQFYALLHFTVLRQLQSKESAFCEDAIHAFSSIILMLFTEICIDGNALDQKGVDKKLVSNLLRVLME